MYINLRLTKKFIMDSQEPTLILTKQEIEQKINRLAYQVYEYNFEEKELVICGIWSRGYTLAERIYAKLKEISPLKLQLIKIQYDKTNKRDSVIKVEPALHNLEEKAVIMCDDVLYTGKSMAYAAVPFLNAGVRKLQCLVLIHRNHPTYPILPTFVGLSLATTLQEHVSVNLSGEENVYLQ